MSKNRVSVVDLNKVKCPSTTEERVGREGDHAAIFTCMVGHQGHLPHWAKCYKSVVAADTTANTPQALMRLYCETGK